MSTLKQYCYLQLSDAVKDYSACAYTGLSYTPYVAQWHMQVMHLITWDINFASLRVCLFLFRLIA